MKNDTDSREWVVSIFSEISKAEHHFNDLQARYRVMASTWLLGTFAGMGYILAGNINFEKLPLPKDFQSTEIFIIGIALASAAGVYLLWTLDLMVYHRLLDAWFIEGWLFERQHSWLPPVRTTMFEFCGKGILNRVIAFYLVSEGIVQAIAITGLCIWMNEHHSKYSEIVLAVSILVALLVLYRMRRSTLNTMDFVNIRKSSVEKTSDKAVIAEV
jgi:hypothetical protein